MIAKSENDIVEEKYIYKINNDRANYGFKYINVITYLYTIDNSSATYEIVKKGKFNWTEEAFTVTFWTWCLRLYN